MSRERRRERLRGLMEEAGAGGILLRRPANFAWYTGGADNRVDRGDEFGVAAILVTRDAEYVVSDNIEAPRMREEETPDLEVAEHPWPEGPEALLQELTGGAPLVGDSAGLHRDLTAEIAPLRYVLDAAAIDRYRALGADAVAAVAETAGSLSPETDEFEASANLIQSCRRRGMDSPVLMAASAARLVRFRHAIPRGGPLGARAMLVVCAERGGLFANHTLYVDFEPPDPDTSRKQQACDEILQRLRDEASRPGRTLAEAFDNCRRFYAETGYPDGWRDHHQGGLTGYASREVVASPSTLQEIQTGQAFAWNPSLTNAKAEETFVLTTDGPEVLTR